MDVPGALKIRQRIVDLLELCPTNAERLWIIRSLFLWAAQRDVIEKAAYKAPELLRPNDDDVAKNPDGQQVRDNHAPIVPPGESEVSGS